MIKKICLLCVILIVGTKSLVSEESRLKWTTELSNDATERVLYYPTLIDIDDNNTLETIIIGKNKTWVLDYKGEIIDTENIGLNLWIKKVDSKFKGAPAIGQLDNDTGKEMIIGGENRLIKYDLDKTGIDSYQTVSGINCTVNMVVLEKLTGSSEQATDNIIFTCYSQEMIEIHVGSLEQDTINPAQLSFKDDEGWPITLNTEIELIDIPVIGDFDQLSPGLEIITVWPPTNNYETTNNFLVISPLGKILKKIPILDTYKVEGKVLANLDNDTNNTLELIYKDYYNGTTRIHLITNNGDYSTNGNWPYTQTNMFENFAPLLVTNINADETLEVITWGLSKDTLESKVIILNPDGTEKINKTLPGDISFTSPLLGNAIGNSKIDIILPIGVQDDTHKTYKENEIIRFDIDNNNLDTTFKFNNLNQDEFSQGLIMGDIDYSSANIEIIAVNNDRGQKIQVKMFQVDLDSGFDSLSLVANEFKYNHKRTGKYTTVIDTTAPYKPSIILDTSNMSGPFVTLNSTSITRTDVWPIKILAYDNESDITTAHYTVGTQKGHADIEEGSEIPYPVDSEINIPLNEFDKSFTGNSLINGDKYYINVKAQNAVGLWSVVESKGVTLDYTIPNQPTDLKINDETTNLELKIDWLTPTDNESGIYKYIVKLETESNTIIAQNTYFAPTESITLRKEDNTKIVYDGVTYNLTITAVNGAGLYSDEIQKSFSVDKSPPEIDKDRIYDPGDHEGSLRESNFNPSNNVITIAWQDPSEPHTAIVSYNIQIVEALNTSNIQKSVTFNYLNIHRELTNRGVLITTYNNYFTIEGLNLVDGKKYQTRLKAKNSEKLWSIPVLSDGFTVDTTPPSKTKRIDDRHYNSSSNIKVYWDESLDDISGIHKYTLYLINNNISKTALNINNVEQYKIETMDNINPQNGKNQKVTFNVTNNLNHDDQYFVAIKAQNLAGLYSELGFSNSFTVDGTPPELTIYKDNKDYVPLTNIEINVSWSSTENSGSIKQYEYSLFDENKNPTLNKTRVEISDETVNSWETTISMNMTIKEPGPLINGAKYYPGIRVQNISDDWTPYKFSDGVTVDATGPEILYLKLNNDQSYVSINHEVMYSFSINDTESDVSAYKVVLSTTNEEEKITSKLRETSYQNNVDLDSYRFNLTGYDFKDGQEIFLWIQAKNRANIESIPTISNKVIIDKSTPNILSNHITGYPSRSEMVINWKAEDPHSIITGYKIEIKDSSDTVTSSTIINSPGINKIGNIYEKSVIINNLNLTGGRNYQAAISIRNGAGLYSATMNSNYAWVDNTPPIKPQDIKINTHNITSSTRNFDVIFSPANDYESQIKSYEISLFTHPEKSISLTDREIEIQTWNINSSDFTNLNHKLKTNLTLNTNSIITHNHVYNLKIKAKNNVNLWTEEVSQNFKVDVTVPLLTVHGDGIDFIVTENSKLLEIIWLSRDDESEIDYSEYAISNQPEDTNKLVWNPTTNSSVNIDVKGFNNNTKYYFGIRAYNKAGLHQENWTDGVIVKLQGKYDTSPPPIPKLVEIPNKTIVTSQSGKLFNTSTRNITLGWEDSDQESDITKAQYRIFHKTIQIFPPIAVGSTDINIWEDTPSTKSVSIDTTDLLKNGNQYNVEIKIINEGDKETTFNRELLVETTPPVITQLNGTGYFNSNENLEIDWESQDEESGINSFSYSLGTQVNQDDLLSWQDTTATRSYKIENLKSLDLQDETGYYINFKVTNGAGQESEIFSRRVTIDTTVPEGVAAVPKSLFSSSTNNISYDFSASDLQSDIQEYEYTLIEKKKNSSEEIILTTHISTVSNIEIDAEAFNGLNHGSKYHVKMRAKNYAGSWSTPALSNETIIDHTEPSEPIVNDTNKFLILKEDRKPFISWSSSDEETGIQQYKFSISEKPVEDESREWYQVGKLTSITLNQITVLPEGEIYIGIKASSKKKGVLKTQSTELTTKELTAGIPYYFGIKSQNKAGLWSSTGYSDGIKVLSSDPEITSIQFNNIDIVNNQFLLNNVSINVTVENNPNLSNYTIKIHDSKTSTLINEYSGEVQGDKQFTTDITNILEDKKSYYADVLIYYDDTNSINTNTAFTETKRSKTFIYHKSSTFFLKNNMTFPNPFNPETELSHIQFQLGRPSIVTLYIYSLNGELIYKKEEEKEYETQEMTWDGKDKFDEIVGNGIYIGYIIAQDKLTNKTEQKIVKIAVMK